MGKFKIGSNWRKSEPQPQPTTKTEPEPEPTMETETDKAETYGTVKAKRPGIIVYLPQKQRDQFKSYCANHETTMKALLSKYIEHCLKTPHTPPRFD